MSEYRAALQEITSWIESKRPALPNLGVTLTAVRTRDVHVPAVAADFDAADTIGRINAWASGEVDFEVLRRSDGEDLFLNHKRVSTFDSEDLNYAYDEFLKHMTDATVS